MTAELSRRAALGAAWSLPVIAAAVAAPAAAASTEPSEPTKVVTCLDRNGHFSIVGTSLVVVFNSTPDIYEVNVHYSDGTSQSFGTNYGTAPERGTRAWTIGLREFPAWVQVHSLDVHFGEPTCPVS